MKLGQVYFVQRAGARQFFSSPCHCLGLHLAILVQGELLRYVQGVCVIIVDCSGVYEKPIV